MSEDTLPEAVQEFARSYQALVNGLSSDVVARLPEQSDEMKAAAEVSTHRLLESMRSLEHYFSTKYVLFSTFFPEEVLKEEITEMKSEIERKDALISKYQGKLHQWQQHVSMNVTPAIIPLDNTKT